MSSSIPNFRFLLDENVRAELAETLISLGLDVKILPKSTSDKFLSSLSLKEKRVVVTNDKDFALLPAAKIFGVVWLRLPQNDLEALIGSFQKLLGECHSFEGNLILLNDHSWKNLPLTQELRHIQFE